LPSRRSQLLSLLQEIKKLARKNNVFFDVAETQGKGSHYRVFYGEKFTTVKSGELKPHEAKLIKKQLGL